LTGPGAAAAISDNSEYVYIGYDHMRRPRCPHRRLRCHWTSRP